MTATRNMTEDELKALPVRVGIQDIAAALGVGRNEAYRQAQAGELIGGLCPVRRLGGQWVGFKPELMRALGYAPESVSEAS